jgi:hypothetical protein
MRPCPFVSAAFLFAPCRCQLCPIGQYNDEDDFTTSCKTCSTGITTCCAGAISSSQCIPTAQRGSRWARRGTCSEGVHPPTHPPTH